MKRHIKPLIIVVLSTLFLFPSVASFYYLLLRSPTWCSRILSFPRLSTLIKAFWPLPEGVYSVIKNLLIAFEHPEGLLYLWLTAVACLLVILRTKQWKVVQNWLCSFSDLKTGAIFLLPLLLLWWLFAQISPQLGITRRTLFLGSLICLFLDFPVLGLVAVVYQRLKENRWNPPLALGWSISWRKTLLWFLYSIIIIPFMMLFTYIWVVPASILGKAITEQPEIARSGPRWLSILFEQYLDLVWLLITGSSLVIVYAIPAILLSKAYTLALSAHKNKE